MSREFLPSGHILYPSGKQDGEAFQIVKMIGHGGFGVTYEAVKLPSPNDLNPGSPLRLDPMARVAVKEFYPEEIAIKKNGKIRASDDEGAADHFKQALHRFRREAERLFYLTQLRTLRASVGEPRGAAAGSEMFAQVRRFLDGDGVNDERSAAMSHHLVSQLDGAMADAARAVIANSPLPIVYSYFNTPATAYYVMEYLSGGTLKDRIRAQRKIFGVKSIELHDATYRLTKPWELADIQHFADRALLALDELHNGIPNQQLVHCDIKPGNIMYREINSDQPILIDFGLARNVAGDSSRSIVGGTSGYAPIEIDVEHRRHNSSTGKREALADRVGPWTDIYGLAVVLRVMATGIDGLAMPTAYQRNIEMQLRQHDPLDDIPGYPASLPTRFGAAIDVGLEVAVERRPQSVTAWRRMLGLADSIAPANSNIAAADDDDDVDDWHPTSSPHSFSATDDAATSHAATSYAATSASVATTPPIPAPHVPVQPFAAPPVHPAQHDGAAASSPVRVNRNVLIAMGMAAILLLLVMVAWSQFSGDERTADGGEETGATADAGDANVGNSATVADNGANSSSDAPPADGNRADIANTADQAAAEAAAGRAVDIAQAAAEAAAREAAPASVPQPLPQPAAAAAITRRFPGLGLTVRTITDPARLAEWRNQGLDPADPVRVIDVDSGARLSGSNAVRINDVYVSDCAGRSTLSALAAAESNRASCLRSESEAVVRFN